MAAGHKNQSCASNNRTIDKHLDEAQSSGNLDLSNRKLNEFPKTAENYDLCDTVETNLSKNRFTELPEEICQFALLEKLNCYQNSIKSFPESITRLQYLGFLDLSRNQLSHLPAFLCELRSLEVLIASGNRLVSIPEEIGQLSSLMELDLSCNEITGLPHQIGDLQQLKILNLRKNLIAELPPGIGKLKLKSLDFSCNRIQVIPLECRDMSGLEELVLDNNPLVNPPAHRCTKGRVHILKYLQILTNREDRKWGLLSESVLNRNTLRRSYQKDDMEAARLRRKAVVSTDSGYITDNPHRWTVGAMENGLDGHVLNSESLKDQRAERHLELQKRICGAELHSPSRSRPAGVTADAADSPASTGGNISPLKIASAGIVESGEDMFARELQRQKQEYEQRKKRAEQVKAEGGVKRSAGRPVTPQTPPTTAMHPLASVPTAKGASRPPQPPVRSASVHTDRRERGGDPADDNVSDSSPQVEAPMDRYITDSHRSSPLSLSSQDGDGRVSGTSSVASSGAQELHSINNRIPTPSDTPSKRVSTSSSIQRRAAATVNSTTDAGVRSDSGSRKAAKSHSSTTVAAGKTGIRAPKPIKSQGRSKTAPLLSSNSSQLSAGISTAFSPSTRSSQSKSTKLPIVKAAMNTAAVGGHRPVSISSSVQPKAAASAGMPNSKFGFQPPGSLNRRSMNSSPPVATNGGQQLETAAEMRHGDDAQHIADIKEIIESRLKVTLPNDVMGELRDGVILCHLANHIRPRTVSQIHVKSSAVPKLSMAKCKRNVDNFIDACKRLGVAQEKICSQADIIDDKRPSPILCTAHALIELKTSVKSSHSIQTTGSRPNTPRSRPSLTGSQSKSSSSARTASKPRSQQPLHSVV